VLSLLAGAVGAGVLVLLGGFSASGFAQSGRAEAILAMALVGTLMALIYAGLLALTRNPEFVSVAKPLLRRLRRRGVE
jgi:putative peptidoglycan lipid II flippase